jgi:DNA-directed RNA polymerase I, II, and III subunit RPABC2
VTYPFLTLYERTKVLSLRASQLAHGSAPFIDVPEYLTDVYEVAKAELEAKRLPYILKRPLPNGEYEYWRLADLMIL